MKQKVLFPYRSKQLIILQLHENSDYNKLKKLLFGFKKKRKKL
jgi:hypothetical protein